MEHYITWALEGSSELICRSSSTFSHTFNFLPQEFKNWVNSQNATLNVPRCWNVTEPLTPVGEVMYETLVVQAFRKDNVHAIMRKFVLAVMGENFLHGTEQEMNMVNVVENEIKSQTPMLLCSAPGYVVFP